jgi:glutamine synthetase
VGDTAFFGAEAEFFIFDNVRFDQNQHSGFYFIDAEEGRWNSGRERDNLGYRPRYKEGYFPVPPTDHYQDMRSEMVQTMIKCGLHIECHHHEVATGGQCEIDQRFDTLVKSADNMMTYKYVVRNTAHQYGKTVTFMPKPLFQDNGSGMHTHQSIWKGDTPLFAGDLLRRAEPAALWYTLAGCQPGIARALSAIIAPTTNSWLSAWRRATKLRWSTWRTRAGKPLGGDVHPDVLGQPQALLPTFRKPPDPLRPIPALEASSRHAHGGPDGVGRKISRSSPVSRWTRRSTILTGRDEQPPPCPASLEAAPRLPLNIYHGFR